MDGAAGGLFVSAVSAGGGGGDVCVNWRGRYVSAALFVEVVWTVLHLLRLRSL